jgi:beta-galactosidase/beta-glucuronidase
MYRQEYPRPGFVRGHWMNLNGAWQFEIEENGRDYLDGAEYKSRIEVPFCPESKLSGVAHRGPLSSLWYRRGFELSPDQLSGSVLLHFGAVDFAALVYVNGARVGGHSGGYTPFSFDISEFVHAGENLLVVNAKDDYQDSTIPSGKQSDKPENYGCMYTRTTGIWQTVWLEFTGKAYFLKTKITPDARSKSIRIEAELNRGVAGTCEAEVRFEGEPVARGLCPVEGSSLDFRLELEAEPKLWDLLQPNLYDIGLRLTENGQPRDEALAYCGFRTVEIKGRQLLLNGKPVFLRQVLDQGYYPDGVYTAPSAADIERDIDAAIGFGFNGARPHEKVFEELYLYYADRKGFLLWGEYPNWNCKMKPSNPVGMRNILGEWRAAIERDYQHPSIIGWCPLNEARFVWKNATDYAGQKALYDLTKAYDKTRPVIGSSGGDLFVTDIHDAHFYTHEGEKLKKLTKSGRYNEAPDFVYAVWRLFQPKLLKKGELLELPCYVSEYGGLSFMVEGKSWGYHGAYATEEAFVEKYVELTNALFELDCIGFCYTQLYDVEQEQNGLLRYDRSSKLSAEGIERIRQCNTQAKV